jgi:hypothetical protein
MPLISPSLLSQFALQATALRVSLQFQPNVGTDDQRAGWMRAVDEAESLASSPPGRLAGLLMGEDWNLRRARSALNRVAAKSVSSGLLLADAASGFASNQSRFEPVTQAVGRARMYVLRARSVRPEHPEERAGRLVRALIESRDPARQTLVAMLDRAFEAHVRKIDARVWSLPDLVLYSEPPADIAYPRRFEDAHPYLMDYLHRTLITINDGCDFDWTLCRSETVESLIRWQLEREGIDPATAAGERKERRISLAKQIPEYSAFQLFCFLTQIRDGRPEGELAEELKRAQDGRVVNFDDAIGAGILWSHLLKASALTGGIDVIHENIDVAYGMAEYEQPNVPSAIARLQVRAAVARLGKETGSSRPEYEDAIRRLRDLENDRDAGRVIRLSSRRF